MSRLWMAGLGVALLALAGCGVEGPPQAPGTVPGITVTGEASAGVVGTF